MTRARAALLVGLGLAVAPLAVEAQPVGKIPRVGYVFFSASECKPTPQAAEFPRGLHDLGYVPGRNIALESRCYATDDELRRILGEFVRVKVDIIVVGVPAQARAAKKATRDIPIVCASCGDPVGLGLVANLARPGGNLTGLASQSGELIGKRVELLRELLPGLSRMAALLYPDNPGTPATVRALDVAGRALGIEIQRVEARVGGDLATAFGSAASAGAGAILVQDDALTSAARVQIAELGLKHRLPTSIGIPENASAGALMTYGPDRSDLYRRAAGFVDRILKGAKPGDLPVEQPTKYELVINLKTARALGLTVPPSLLLKADRTIE